MSSVVLGRSTPTEEKLVRREASSKGKKRTCQGLLEEKGKGKETNLSRVALGRV